MPLNSFDYASAVRVSSQYDYVTVWSLEFVS